MKRMAIILMSLVGFAIAQNAKSKALTTISSKAKASGKFVYTNTGGEGRIMVDSIGKWFGSSDEIFTTTYNEIQALKKAKNLTPGKTYLLSDYGYYVKAMTSATISNSGLLYTYLPNTFNQYLQNFPVTNGEVVVWGNKLWTSNGTNSAPINDAELDENFTVIDPGEVEGYGIAELKVSVDLDALLVYSYHSVKHDIANSFSAAPAGFYGLNVEPQMWADEFQAIVGKNRGNIINNRIKDISSFFISNTVIAPSASIKQNYIGEKCQFNYNHVNNGAIFDNVLLDNSLLNNNVVLNNCTIDSNTLSANSSISYIHANDASRISRNSLESNSFFWDLDLMENALVAENVLFDSRISNVKTSFADFLIRDTLSSSILSNISMEGLSRIENCNWDQDTVQFIDLKNAVIDRFHSGISSSKLTDTRLSGLGMNGNILNVEFIDCDLQIYCTNDLRNAKFIGVQGKVITEDLYPDLFDTDFYKTVSLASDGNVYLSYFNGVEMVYILIK